VSNKNFEPYVIVSAPHDSSDVFLHDIDSKRILLTYEGELHLETSNGNILKKSYDLINTIHGQQKGYVFYKQTKEHMNLIDSLFGNEWRNELKNPLPVVEERNPDLLWEGKIGTNSLQLFEYSDKALALFSSEHMTDVSNFMYNPSLAHPLGKRAGYIISKTRGKGIGDIKRMIPINFEELYKKSQPIISSNPVQNQTLIESRNISEGGNIFNVELWLYSPASYALVFEPFVSIERSNIKESNLTINGKRLVGYILAKANNKAISELMEILPGVNLNDNTADTQPITTQITTAKKEDRNIEESIIPIILKLTSITDLVRKELFGKVIIYGPNDDVENAYGNEQENKIIFSGNTENNTIIVLELI